MTQEQKAKAYDEALNRAKNTIEVNQTIPDIVECIESIFPELKENEDERIRKKLLQIAKESEDTFYMPMTPYTREHLIAWLEKQDSCYTFEIKKGHWYKCVCDYMLNGSDLMFKNDKLYYCRKDWRLRGEIDERNVKDIGVNGYKSFFRPATNQEIKDWLEKQKERGPLSKDEEYTLARIIEYLEDNDCPSKWKDLLHDVYALPYQKEQKEDVTKDKIAEYLKKLILDQSQRGAHMLDYEGRIEEEVDFIISIAKKELKKVEQKSAYKVKPKFHQGEWITNGNYTWKIIEVKPLDYILQSQDGNIVDDTTSHVDEQFHSFTIEDAKDGDVLAAHECIVLFKEIDGLNIKCHCTYHFMNNPSFYVNTLQNKSAFYPATKEQRDTLFKAMTDAGCTFDFEKKELKQKSDWNENDKDFMYETLSNLTELKDRYGEGYGNVGKCIEWVKSLKERYAWKPSDEQMEALDWALSLAKNCGDECAFYLRTLQDQLKKLKE